MVRDQDKPGSDRDPSSVKPLEEPLREHLGKELRSTYHALEEKPAFLGDSVVPAKFDGLIRKLEAMDRKRVEAIHDKGVAAVENALISGSDATPHKEN